MSKYTARDFALVCVLGVTATFAGCYKPAAGNAGGSAASPMVTFYPEAKPSPSAAPLPEPTPSAGASPTPAVTENKQLASAVDAALRNPLPNMTPSATASSTRPVGSRSPQRKTPVRTKVLDAPEASGGTQGITFDALVFPIEVGQKFEEKLLTPSIRDLFGKRVKIRGYMHPSCPVQTGVTSFIFVRDDQSCCFGPKALIYDCIIVDMVPGRTTNYSLKPIAVEGVLTLREFKDLDGNHLAIYHLDADSAE